MTKEEIRTLFNKATDEQWAQTDTTHRFVKPFLRTGRMKKLDKQLGEIIVELAKGEGFGFDELSDYFSKIEEHFYKETEFIRHSTEKYRLCSPALDTFMKFLRVFPAYLSVLKFDETSPLEEHYLEIFDTTVKRISNNENVHAGYYFAVLEQISKDYSPFETENGDFLTNQQVKLLNYTYSIDNLFCGIVGENITCGDYEFVDYTKALCFLADKGYATNQACQELLTEWVIDVINAFRFLIWEIVAEANVHFKILEELDNDLIAEGSSKYAGSFIAYAAVIFESLWAREDVEYSEVNDERQDYEIQPGFYNTVPMYQAEFFERIFKRGNQESIDCQKRIKAECGF